MKSIMMTYPEFRALPKGLKQLLLASESFFFDETEARPKDGLHDGQTLAILNHIARRSGPPMPFHPNWRN